MTKDEFAALLQGLGFHADNVNGCVVVTTPNKHDLRKVQAIAQAVGYGMSFGWRMANDKKGAADSTEG